MEFFGASLHFAPEAAASLTLVLALIVYFQHAVHIASLTVHRDL